jgi:hypothetical protein
MLLTSKGVIKLTDYGFMKQILNELAERKKVEIVDGTRDLGF